MNFSVNNNINNYQFCELFKILYLSLHGQDKALGMNIEFANAALEQLYLTGTTNDRKYKRLSKDIIRRYIKVVNYIKAARRIEDLFLIKSLHYERKKGDLKGVDAVWINDQYRLLFYTSPDEGGIIVNALLFEISKHYE